MSLARGLDYYTGVIYEAVLTGTIVDVIAEQQRVAMAAQVASRAATKDKKKSKRGDDEEDEEGDIVTVGGVGSVAAGGRYDKLVNMFDKKSNVPCVGFSVGVERLFAVMEAKLKLDNTKMRANQTEVYVITPQKGMAEQRMELCQELWSADIKTEYSYKLNPKVLHQLQFCEDNSIPLAVIIGEQEIVDKTVKLRDVITREEVTII
jgi:histidyl-tRNA synthetase